MNQIALFIFPCLLLMSGCSGSKSEAGSKSGASQESLQTPDYEIEWIKQELLLVRQYYPDNSWLFSLEDRRQVGVHPFVRHGAIQLSPGGSHLLTVDQVDLKLLIAPIRGLFEGNRAIEGIDIPPMSPLNSEAGKLDNTRAVWVSNKEVYVEHFNRETGKHQCSILEREGGRWESVQHCFDLLRFQGLVNKISRLGRDLYAVHSSDEGSRIIEVVRWSLEDGLQTTEYPTIMLGLYGDVRVYFEEEVAELYFSSSKPIEPDGNILNYSEPDPPGQLSTLYRWTSVEGFRATDLIVQKGGSLLSVLSRRIAWFDTESTRLCTAIHGGDSTCYLIDLKAE